MGGDILSLVGMLLTVAAVLALAYYTTRYLAKMRTPFFPGGGSGAMRLVSQMALSGEHRLVLVHVGSRYLLLGLAGGSITLLCELSEEDQALFLAESKEGQNPSFSAAFLEQLRRKPK